MTNNIKLIPGKLYQIKLPGLDGIKVYSDERGRTPDAIILKNKHPYLLIRIDKAKYTAPGAYYIFLIGKLEYSRYMDDTDLRWFKEV